MTGKVGLSAIAIGGDVTHFFTFIAIGFGGASQIIVAQYLGAKQTDKLNRFVGTSLAFLLLFTIFISAFCLFFKSEMLWLKVLPIQISMILYRFGTNL
jgi:Na+-driven multidrug efflux pump